MSDLDLALQAFNKAKAQGDVVNAKRFAQIALDLDAGFAPPAPAYTPPPVDPTRPLPDAADRSVLREAIADPLLQVGKGAVTGTRFLTDVFGADNPISQKLSGVEDFIDDLLSAQAKRDQQEVARIMQQAEDKGLGEQIMAGLQAMSVAPVDLIANAFGTSAPVLIGGLLGSAAGAPAIAVGTGLGVLTGVGVTKDAIYDAVYQELVSAGVPESEAETAAKEAQAYGGENLDNIGLGGFLGGLAARFGLEKTVLGNIGRNLAQDIPEEAIEEAARRGVIAEASRAAIAEAIPEALQGGQEQFSRNVALQREGFDVPTGRGVATAATLEGAVGAPVGGIAAGAQAFGRAEGERGAAEFLQSLVDEFDKIPAVAEAVAATPEARVPSPEAEAAPEAGAAPEPDITIEDPADLTDEQVAALMKAFGDKEELEFLSSLQTLTPEEQADLEAGVEVTRKNYVRFGKYFVPQELAEGVDLTEKNLSERIAKVTSARNKMAAIGQGIARTTSLVTELERINALPAEDKATALQELNISEEELNTELEAAKQQATLFNELAFKLDEQGRIVGQETKTGERRLVPETQDPSFKLAQEAALEQEREAYAEAERELRTFSTENAAPVQKLTSSKNKDLTPEEVSAKKYFGADGVTSPEVALLNIAADVAADDATTQELKNKRDKQPNLPGDEYIDTAAEEFIGHKTQGRLTPSQRKTALEAYQWVRNNLKGTPVTQLEELINRFKAQRQDAIAAGARALRGAEQRKASKKGTLRVPERPEGRPGEVIQAEIPTAAEAAPTIAEEAERAVLEEMGLKRRPTSEKRLAEFTRRMKQKIAELEQESQAAFESLTSEDIARQIEEQGIVIPETRTKYKGKDIDPEVVAIAETGNLNRTIEALLNTLPKELRPIVRKMRKMASATKIEIAPVENGRPGKYDSDTNTITLDPERGLNTGIFFHELAHAALARRLNDPNSAEAKAFFDFFSQIKDQMGDAYGGTNLDEFVSELAGNSEFRNLLKTIKAPKGKTMWQTVLDKILELFGVTLSKDSNAYKVSLAFVDGILSLDPSVEPPPLSKVFFANAKPKVALKEAISKLNPFSVDNAKSVISKITGTGAPTLRTQAMGFLRFDNLFDMYGKHLKSLGVIIDETELRQGQQEQDIEEVNKKYNAMLVILNKFKAPMRAMSKMAIAARIARVDILKDKPKEAKKAAAWEEGRKVFDSLPKEVQNVYRVMRNDFDKMYEEYVENVLSTITNEALRAEVAKKFKEDPPIAGYVPFRRYGQFVLVYVDKDTKKRTVRAFESARERDMEIQELGLTQRPDVQEAVDSADTEEAEEQVRQRKLGVGEYITVNSLREATTKTLPPEGFVAELMEKIREDGREQKLSKAQIDSQVETIYGAYLDLFPESSISKSFKKAKDVPGASEDLVRAYGDTMVKWARKMADIKHNGKIEKAFRDLKKEAETYRQTEPSDPSPETIMAAAQSILDRQDFTLNPTFSPLSRWATTGSYTMFMAGNISSGVVNLSSIPLLTFPILAGKFGGIKASAALTKASKVAVIDIMKTEGVPKWGTAEYQNGRYVALYNILKDHGQLRHTLAREVLEGARQTTEEYTGRGSRFLNLLSLPIERTERYNRTTTAITAFDLALDSGMSTEEAAKYALRTVKDVNTSGMASTAPRWMQTDIGRVMFTFKSFIWQSSYVTAKAFVDSIKGSPERTRIEAFRQLAYTFGMSYAVAGVFGLPFFGAISVLTNMINSLLDDDEEPFNLRREMMLIMPEAMTKGPLNYYTNLEISNRASVANGILFREDPYEIEKYGYLQSMALQAFGPLGSYAMDAPYGMRLIAEGEVSRGIERLAPSWVRNGIKTMRFAQEGARTIDGRPIDEDLTAYNLYMQALGFTPANISSLYETRALAKQYENQVLTARSNLLKRRYLALTTGDPDLFAETERKIFDFMSRYPGLITPDTLNRSFKSRTAQEQEYVAGIRFNKGFFSNLTPLFDRLEDVNYYGAL